MLEPLDPADACRDRDAWADTVTYLAHAVAAAHAHRYVAAACTDEPPTWREALDRLVRHADLTAADMRRAREIRGWAASLKPRRSDSYRSRLAACLCREQLTTAELPLAASAVRAFNLHLYYEIRGRKSATRRTQDADHDGGPDEARKPRQRGRLAAQSKPTRSPPAS